MGMVVPAELAQTGYGIETLRALCANFARVRLITFRHNWFDDAQQETFLLLAEGPAAAARPRNWCRWAESRTSRRWMTAGPAMRPSG